MKFTDIPDYNNLLLSFVKAEKGKSKRGYVKRFVKNLEKNLLKLQSELINQTYEPCPLKNFTLQKFLIIKIKVLFQMFLQREHIEFHCV